MESLKKVIFSKRIIALNETFAPLGGQGKVCAILWNETIAGRSAPDLLSVFHQFFIRNMSHRKIKLYLDNCSSQNKNWNLFLHLILLINSNLISTTEIELIYFEPGHTFMSADSFHHAVEKSMQEAKKVFTFDDFKRCVEKASKKPNDTVALQHSDFFTPTVTASAYQISKLKPRPYIQNIKRVVLKRGSYHMKYSNNVDGTLLSTIFFTCKQLKMVQRKDFDLLQTLKFSSEPRGIDIEQKENICKHLVPLMPPDKAVYWKQLPVATNKY